MLHWVKNDSRNSTADHAYNQITIKESFLNNCMSYFRLDINLAQIGGRFIARLFKATLSVVAHPLVVKVVIVEIDESKFGRRKYNRGRVEGQWLFGGFLRGTGRVFIVPVE